MSPLSRIITAALGVIALAAGFVLTTSATASATGSGYYLDCSAATDGTGTQTSPWNSLTDADNHIFGPGDTLYLAAGSDCTGTLSPQGSGTATSPIVITSNGSGAAPIVDGDGAQWAVHLTDQSYWTIENLHVTNPSTTRAQRAGIEVDSTTTADKAGIVITGNDVADTAGWGDKASNASAYTFSAGIVVHDTAANVGHFAGISITDNYVHDTGGGGIKITGDTSTYNTAVYVGYNTIHAAGGDGIVVHDSDGPLVEHNTALDLGQGDYPFTGGNFAGMWPYNSNNPTFQYNVVGRGMPASFDAMAWDCDNLNTGTCTYQYNYSYGNAGGFYMDCLAACGSGADSTNVVLRYNISQDDCRMVLDNTGTGMTYIYNNTFVCAGRPIVDSISSNKVVTNNIFYAPSGTFATGTNVSYDSNSYFGGVTPPSGDAHAQTGNPELVAPGSGGESLGTETGYQLLTGSANLGAGAVIANNGGSDFFGNPVSATAAPNRGAYNGSGVGPSALPLSSLFTTVGVTDDANPNAGALSSASNSGRTFSEEALENAGLTQGKQVTAGGVTFTWHPGNLGDPDHVVAAGQTVAVSGTGTKLGFLGFSTSNSPGGTGTLTFSDGSTQTFTLNLTDWWNTTPNSGNVQVVQATYQNQHNTPYDATNTAAYSQTATLWEETVSLPAGKSLVSVTLPAGTGAITAPTAQHVFDIEIGS